MQSSKKIGNKNHGTHSNNSMSEKDSIKISTITTAITGSAGGAGIGAAFGVAGAVIGAVGIGLLIIALVSSESK